MFSKRPRATRRISYAIAHNCQLALLLGTNLFFRTGTSKIIGQWINSSLTHELSAFIYLTHFNGRPKLHNITCSIFSARKLWPWWFCIDKVHCFLLKRDTLSMFCLRIFIFKNIGIILYLLVSLSKLWIIYSLFSITQKFQIKKTIYSNSIFFTLYSTCQYIFFELSYNLYFDRCGEYNLVLGPVLWVGILWIIC